MNQQQLKQLQEIKNELTRFMLTYKFGMDELNTKLKILQEEFQLIHDYNPIEHIKTRLKSPESIIKKLYRKNLEISIDSIQKNIRDIVGIRITCSFISDIYRLSDMIQKQQDITTIHVKDYIKNPKPNGYKSLHLIVSVPVFLSDRVEEVYGEIQIRTIAMDFWASLEHKIYYKYDKEIPKYLLTELTNAAYVANELDEKMEKLHNKVKDFKQEDVEDAATFNEEKIQLSDNILSSFMKDETNH